MLRLTTTKAITFSRKFASPWAKNSVSKSNLNYHRTLSHKPHKLKHDYHRLLLPLKNGQNTTPYETKPLMNDKMYRLFSSKNPQSSKKEENSIENLQDSQQSSQIITDESWEAINQQKQKHESEILKKIHEEEDLLNKAKILAQSDDAVVIHSLDESKFTENLLKTKKYVELSDIRSTGLKSNSDSNIRV